MANKNRYANEILLMVGDDHLTGEQVHTNLKEIYPLIGLGTVYRNLNQLVDEGRLMKTHGVFTEILYEKQKEPHGHIVCSQSKKAYDIDIKNLDLESLRLPENFTVKEVNLAIFGSFSSGETCSVIVKKHKIEE